MFEYKSGILRDVTGLLWQALREAEKALKMSQRKDYYKILSLDRSANIRDIKRVHCKATLLA